jgi:hypothetical protein
LVIIVRSDGAAVGLKDFTAEAGVSTRRSPKDTFIAVYGRMPVLEVLQDDSLQRLLT